jgi:hypothetical protein
MARKQRPFYYASEEQFRWLQIIVSRLDPRVNTNDVAQLKELAESLIPDRTAKDERASNAEGGNEAGSGDGSGEQEEGMEGVVDGIGTLMLDPLGRESPLPLRMGLILEYIGESASVAFHRKVREYVQSQRPDARLIGARFPEPHDPTDPVDLVNADEPTDHHTIPDHSTSPHTHLTSPLPGLSSSPTSIFSSSTTLRSRLPPRHLADPLIDRFFKQVHSIFWVFSPDYFIRLLDGTYAAYEADLYGEDAETVLGEDERWKFEKPSWMCSLFTVLALGSSSGEDGELFKPSDFFAVAKGLSRALVEDESIESIQALLLMVPPTFWVC